MRENRQERRLNDAPCGKAQQQSEHMCTTVDGRSFDSVNENNAPYVFSLKYFFEIYLAWKRKQ